MFASGTYFLQLLVLVVCHGLTVADIARYFLVKRSMSWSQSQEFCQKYFVDLTVISTENEYHCLQTATSGERVSFWIGLQRNEDNSWTWVDGEENVHYEKWRENKVGDCGSFEAMLMKPNKMLSRFCEEPHAFVCQGIDI
uniref:C-type lectin domain-containing protein n=1 Tax=Neogobius melanostomus TaxID=47308 RepID=A0A8C6V7S5_9GOBI